MIGIHHQKGSFSDRWIAYCKENDVSYKIVNCYDSDIVSQLKDCDAFMWHHDHADYRDALFAKQLLYSLQLAGKKVFPDFNTNWHFDDKVGQKYLLEAIGAPLVPSYVFYDKGEALNWIKLASFPKVFKLRTGAGSSNVKLVKIARDASGLVQKAFGRGFPQYDRLASLKERYRKYKEGKDSLLTVCKGIGRLFITTKFAKIHAREKGYIYFQDFIPENKYDIRVIVIDHRAFAIKRLVRDGDFRASGSGNILYEKSEFDEKCVQIAFDVNKKLASQCIAYDFVFDHNERPLIVEVSYGFVVKVYDRCTGYWDSDLKWHPDKFNPQEWMVDAVVNAKNDYKNSSPMK
jgi:glutathione synthase/RimK-type ligase-like ATP-grasp enzyme